jgi:hypothetical protein
MPKRATPRYTVEAGRQILCDGEPFIAIMRVGHTHPVTADEVTHVIAALLNKSRWKSPYPSDYLRSGNAPRPRRRSR